jgi:hypothetical protein
MNAGRAHHGNHDQMLTPVANRRMVGMNVLFALARKRPMSTICATFMAGLALLGASGCHGPAVTADKACTDLATARCVQLQSCEPAQLASLYGDVATCEAREKLSCTPSLSGLTGSSATADQYEKCASALAASACSSLYTRNPPTDCVPQPGELADGAACGDDAQCASTYCRIFEAPPSLNICGVCSERALVGGACVGDDDCDFSLACVAIFSSPTVATQQCVSRGGVGATCDSDQQCDPFSACVSGTCMPPGSVGMTCDRNAQDCDPTQGLYCTALSVCAVDIVAAAGEPCGSPSYYEPCAAGGLCVPNVNTCLAAVPDGAVCGGRFVAAEACQQPARCLGITDTTGGVCTLPNPAACK